MHKKPSTTKQGFNTQPPEGGWAGLAQHVVGGGVVSTHSHPKVAGAQAYGAAQFGHVSTHSHPKVAGASLMRWRTIISVSTHSHPKVAGPPG